MFMVSLDRAKSILAAFIKSPTKPKYIRQIESNCELSYERVQHYLKELEESKVLTSQTKGKIKEYTINRKSETALKLFAILEMERRQVFYSKIPHFQVWLTSLVTDLDKTLEKNNAEIKFILLFGSTARGDAKASSDVDILIVARNVGRGLESEVNQLKTNLETLSGRIFSFHLVGYKEFKSKWKREPVYATIWLDYVVLSGEENFWKVVLERGEPI
jgi:predicted nucleotidyltransferase/predicted transcriptional regulator